MTLPKRTPEEWLTVVRVGRPNRVVFAEGSSDARLLRALMGFPQTVDVRTADEVEYEPAQSAFVGSNKARVLAIAKQFEALSDDDPIKPDILDHSRCLIDGDFNALAEAEHSISSKGILVVTHYSNLLACIVTQDWFRTCMLAAFGWEPDQEAWATLKTALCFAFFCRYKNAADNLNRTAPELSSYFAKANGTVAFRDAAYVQSYFGLQGAACQEVVESAYDGIANASDHRFLINSNDLFSASYGLLKLHKSIGSKIQVSNIREVVLAMAPPLLSSDPRVQALVDWAAR